MILPRRRWFILALLFVASVLNYFDRQTLSILKPTIKAEFGLTDADYSTLLTVFMVPYIFMYVLGGRLVDRHGSRVCMAWFVGVWSLATAATGWVRNVWHLGICRFVLGVAEPGNWPGGIRALSILFPAHQRGFAISVFSAGAALGSILAPPIIAWMAVHHGWRSAFWIPGAVGVAWVAAWWVTFRRSDDEAPPDEAARPAWSELLRRRELWGLLLARLISDPVWYFYLFWIPGYFQEKLGLSLTQAGAIGWIPFLAADLGGIGSAALSDRFVRGGVAPVDARKRVLFAMAILGPLGVLAPSLGSTTGVLVVFGLVGMMCLAWTFNTATLIGDIFPKNATGAVMGIVGAAGATGALIFNSQIGAVVEKYGYGPVFLVTGVLHPIAAVVLSLLVRANPATAK